MCSQDHLCPKGGLCATRHDVRPHDNMQPGDHQCAGHDVCPCHDVRTEGLLSMLYLATFHNVCARDDLCAGHHVCTRDDLLTCHHLCSGSRRIGPRGVAASRGRPRRRVGPHRQRPDFVDGVAPSGNAVKHFDLANTSTKRKRVGPQHSSQTHSLALRACIAGPRPEITLHSVARRGTGGNEPTAGRGGSAAPLVVSNQAAPEKPGGCRSQRTGLSDGCMCAIMGRGCCVSAIGPCVRFGLCR